MASRELFQAVETRRCGHAGLDVDAVRVGLTFRHRFEVDRRHDAVAEFSAFTHATHAPTSRSHSFAGQLAGLLHPSGELSFVELVALTDVEVTHVLALGCGRRN